MIIVTYKSETILTIGKSVGTRYQMPFLSKSIRIDRPIDDTISRRCTSADNLA